MPDLSKIKLDGTTYNLKDTVARDGLATIPTKINDLTKYKNFGIGYIDCTNVNRYIFVSNVNFSKTGDSAFSSYFLLMLIRGTNNFASQVTIAGTGSFDFYDINSNTENGYVAQISSTTIATLKYGTLYIARLNDGGLDLYPLATTSEVNSLITSAIGNINSFEVSVVASLPTSDIDTHTIYFVSNSSSGDSIYDEYMYINNSWEKIGSTAVDLSNYLQKTDISDWAKASTKPSYTASEVGAAASNHTHTQIGTYNQSGDGYVKTSINYIQIAASTNGGSTQNVLTLTGTTTTIHKVVTPTADGDAANKKYVDDSIAAITHPTNVSTFTNDAGYLTLADLPIYDGTVV